MLSIADRAEIFRLGTIVGFFEPQESIAWADAAIAAEDAPSDALIEVSMGAGANSAKMVSLLKDCAGDQTPGRPRDVFFGLLAEKLATDADAAESIAYQLKTLRSAYDAPDAVMVEASNLAGPFAGDVAVATAAVTAFLAPYAAHAAAWRA